MNISCIIIGGIIILVALFLAFVIFIKVKIKLTLKRLDQIFLPIMMEMNRDLQETDNQEHPPKN